jgi:hypothetical protein
MDGTEHMGYSLTVTAAHQILGLDKSGHADASSTMNCKSKLFRVMSSEITFANNLPDLAHKVHLDGLRNNQQMLIQTPTHLSKYTIKIQIF